MTDQFHCDRERHVRALKIAHSRAAKVGRNAARQPGRKTDAAIHALLQAGVGGFDAFLNT
jgi:hypothetical protein